jgi:hypothetical protein
LYDDPLGGMSDEPRAFGFDLIELRAPELGV